jgi:hypothetical protein
VAVSAHGNSIVANRFNEWRLTACGTWWLASISDPRESQPTLRSGWKPLGTARTGRLAEGTIHNTMDIFRNTCQNSHALPQIQDNCSTPTSKIYEALSISQSVMCQYTVRYSPLRTRSGAVVLIGPHNLTIVAASFHAKKESRRAATVHRLKLDHPAINQIRQAALLF